MTDAVFGCQAPVARAIRIYDADLVGGLKLIYLAGKNDVPGWPILRGNRRYAGTSVMFATGVSVCWTGCSEKSKGEVAVGWIGAGEKAESGVEAASVANRSIVGVEAGETRRPNPDTTKVTNNKKPQNKTSPAAIQSVRLFVVIPLL